MRLVAAAPLALAALLAAGPRLALAEVATGPLPETIPADPWATFVYETPAPTYRLRLAIEEVSMVGVAFIGYLVQNPPPSFPGVPPVPIWEKIRFAPGSWTFDPDDLATNFAGHATAGAIYYLVARGNRVSVPEAFLWTLGASTLWELVEFKEPTSINDVLVTPVAGMAIGEAFTQLSAWFDRAGADGVSRGLAWIFDPAKKLHDWIDGAVPVRDPATSGWHEFQALLGGGFLSQGGGPTYTALQFAASTRLFRAPGYGEAGRMGFGFADGNVSRIGLSATFAAGRNVDFLFDTETALLGHYSRDLREDGDGGLDGWDLFVGGTVGYEFGSHAWDLAGDRPKNQVSMVRFPGLDLRSRLFAGSLAVAGSVDLALTFGGVEAFAVYWPVSLPPDLGLPPVYLAHGYYYGLGLHVAPALEVSWESWGLGGAADSDLFAGFKAPFSVPTPGTMASLSDGRTLASAWLRRRVPDQGLEFALRWDWRDRWGSVNGLRASQQERALLGSFAVVF